MDKQEIELRAARARQAIDELRQTLLQGRGAAVADAQSPPSPSAPFPAKAGTKSAHPHCPVIAIHGVGDFEHGDVVSQIAGSEVFSQDNDFRRQTLFMGNARYTLLEDDKLTGNGMRIPRFVEVNWSDVRKPLSSVLGLLRNFVMVVFAILQIGEAGVDGSRQLGAPLRMGWLVRAAVTLLIWASLLPMLSALLWKVDVNTRLAVGLLLAGGVCYLAVLLRGISPIIGIGGMVFGTLCLAAGAYACLGVERVEVLDGGAVVGYKVVSQHGRDFVSLWSGALHSWAVLVTGAVLLLAAIEVMFFMRQGSDAQPRAALSLESLLKLLRLRMTRVACLWLPIVLIVIVQPLTVSSILLSMTDSQQEVWGRVFQQNLAFQPRAGQIAGAIVAVGLLLLLLVGLSQYKAVTLMGGIKSMLLSVLLGAGLLYGAWWLSQGADMACECCVRANWIALLGFVLVFSGLATFLFYNMRRLSPDDDRPGELKAMLWQPSGGVVRMWANWLFCLYPVVVVGALGYLAWQSYLQYHLGAQVMAELFARYSPCEQSAQALRVDQAYLQSTKFAIVLLPLAARPFANLLDALGDVFYFVVKSDTLQTRDDTRPRLAHALKSMLHYPNAKRLIVFAHSQGTVISAKLLDEVADELAQSQTQLTLITAGSPLTSLYARFLDVNIGAKFAALCDAKPSRFSWLNVTRRSDYIGSAVLHKGIKNYALHTRGDHTGYWEDQALLRWLSELSHDKPSPPQPAEIVNW